jgi:hypothetical protein
VRLVYLLFCFTTDHYIYYELFAFGKLGTWCVRFAYLFFFTTDDYVYYELLFTTNAFGTIRTWCVPFP